MEELYPAISADSQPDLSGFEEIWMEIGFGGAEHLLHLARNHPENGIIGAEPFLNGVARAVGGVEEFDLKNLFLHHGDARDVMDSLSDSVLSRLYILFPDPWPKTRHKKRRIINEAFLDDVCRVLKPGGTLFFASDITDYVEWTVTRLKKNERFALEYDGPSDWRNPYSGWPGTRYEAKAIKAGRPCQYLRFKHAA